MATPPPSWQDVLQLAAPIAAGLTGLAAAALKLSQSYQKGRQDSQKTDNEREAGNLAEATRLREELRNELQAQKNRADEAEAEVSTWRSAFYSLRDTAARLLGNALNACHRAQSELEANKHPEAARRLGLLIETLERVTLPPSPEEAERPVALRGVKFPPDRE